MGSGPRYADDGSRIELTARSADSGQNTYQSSPIGIVRSSATLARLFSWADGGLIPIPHPRERRPVIADWLVARIAAKAPTRQRVGPPGGQAARHASATLR